MVLCEIRQELVVLVIFFYRFSTLGSHLCDRLRAARVTPGADADVRMRAL